MFEWLRERIMGARTHAEHGAADHRCCQVCNCLSYCAQQNRDGITRPRLKSLPRQKRSNFKISAKSGCQYCPYVVQSLPLMGSDEEDPEVELLCYADSPTELHSATNGENYDIVEIYPHSDTKGSFPQVAKDVPRENVAETSLRFIQQKYEECCKSHRCCPEVKSRLPKRVVDISNNKYRLAVPDDKETAPYATLSYSWGGERFCATYTESLDKILERGFEEKDLPIVFVEAAKIARRLNITYLWIDSLCIIQDDLEDWRDQAAQMGQIYESAALTIAASLIRSPYDSLFVGRNPKYAEIELRDSSTRIHGGIVFKARRKIPYGIHAKIGRSNDIDRLDTRAWGLQEKLLSKRLVAFTGAEVQWTCQRYKLCECQTKSYEPQIPFLMPTKEVEINEKYGYAKAWSRILENYSGRRLTYYKDRLPALSGLAKKFKEKTNFKYIAGVWQETIWYDLMWQCDVITADALFVDTTAKSYMGPRFSWVSAPVAINYRLARHSYPGVRVRHMELIDFQYTDAELGGLGRAVDGCITSRAPAVAACLRRTSETRIGYELLIMGVVYPPNSDQRATCEFSIDMHYTAGVDASIGKDAFHDPDDRNRPREFENGETAVVLLGIYSIHQPNSLYQNFLILKPSTGDPSAYERIGVGSGKIYDGTEFPAQPELVQPFHWLSVDCKRRGGSLEDIAVQTMRLV